MEHFATYASSSSSAGRERPANGSAACEKPGAETLWPRSRGSVESKPKKDIAALLQEQIPAGGLCWAGVHETKI
jgi:hypothetical protein